MTDTPRTLSAILALLADNSSSAISPQDLRDALVSLIEPVPAGGFPGAAVGTDEVALSLVANGDFSHNSNRYHLPSGGDPWLPMGVRHDPQGWVVAASYTAPYSGGTVPANSSVLLPPGIYMIGTDIVQPGSPARLSFRFDWVDDPTVDPVYGGSAAFYPPSFGLQDNQPAAASLGDYVESGFYRQTQTMYDEGIRIAPKLFQNTGSDLDINYADLFIVKIH